MNQNRPQPTASAGEFQIIIDGVAVPAPAGQSVAAVLITAGYRAFRLDPKTGRPRGLFCGIGLCHDCLVTVNGRPGVRACQTVVEPDMVVETGLTDREAGR